MRHDDYEAMRRVVKADTEAEVLDVIEAIRENADELGADLATLEIVHLRLVACFVAPEEDDE